MQTQRKQTACANTYVLLSNIRRAAERAQTGSLSFYGMSYTCEGTRTEVKDRATDIRYELILRPLSLDAD